MKHIKTFESFLFEFKEVGPLYHFTTFDSLEGILEEDKMESSDVLKYISFTRNPLLGSAETFKRRNVRITFDGDEMSNKFHIEPFMYDPSKDELFSVSFREPISYTQLRKQYGEEREERITQSEIKGIKKYISSIEVIRGKDEDFEKRLVELEKNNPQIEFNIVHKFATPSQLHFQKIAA